jgi:hypothetical protein
MAAAAVPAAAAAVPAAAVPASAAMPAAAVPAAAMAAAAVPAAMAAMTGESDSGKGQRRGQCRDQCQFTKHHRHSSSSPAAWTLSNQSSGSKASRAYSPI